MRKTLIALAALLSASPALPQASAAIAAGKASPSPLAPSEIVAAAPKADWTAIPARDLLVMDLAPDAKGRPRRVVIQLMPPPFSAGLNLWSREDGVPGSGSYQGQPNAALVTNDQDFAGCLELQKTEATQKLRSFAQTPIQPGLYLRVTARVKAGSGNLPSVRIAAWAGDVSGANVAGLPQTGPSVQITSYGQVVTVSAIISPASRMGVDLP